MIDNPQTPDPTTALTSAVYGALRDFQQSADWPQLRLPQMRQHLAEHIARDVTLTPGALPPAPGDAVTVDELAHAIDNSTPYPIELDSSLCRFMAERLLEMLAIGKRDEHPVWQPEEDRPSGPQPEPMDPEELRVDPAVLPAVPVPPATHATGRGAVLAEAIRRVEAERDATDVNVAEYPRYDWKERAALEGALRVLRRMADEAQQQTPATVLLETADRIDAAPLPPDHPDTFISGVRWTTGQIRHIAREEA